MNYDTLTFLTKGCTAFIEKIQPLDLFRDEVVSLTTSINNINSYKDIMTHSDEKQLVTKFVTDSSTLPVLNRKYKRTSTAHRQKFHMAMDSRQLQYRNNQATQRSYASVVRCHNPNEITVQPVLPPIEAKTYSPRKKKKCTE
jgi:hypothetical protein